MRWIEITAKDKLFGNLWLQVEVRIVWCLNLFFGWQGYRVVDVQNVKR